MESNVESHSMEGYYRIIEKYEGPEGVIREKVKRVVNDIKINGEDPKFYWIDSNPENPILYD